MGTGLVLTYPPCLPQVTDSTVMRSKQIFFTLSPDGLTQFSLDSTVFIDLQRWAGGRGQEGRGRGRRLKQ